MDATEASPARSGGMLRAILVPPAKAVLFLINRGIRLVSHDPSFFEPERFPWAKEVEAMYPDIREECVRIVGDLNRIPNLEDLGDAGSKKLAQGGDWKAVLLLMFGQPIANNVARCPKTYAALQKIPGCKSALFSILAPGVHLQRHCGPFAGVLRYHMGIIVPTGNKCRIEVDDISRCWQEGKSLIFDDTHPHEVWNESGQLRVVLFVDVVRPTIAPIRWVIEFLFAVGARTPFAQNFIRNANKAAEAI